MSNPTPTLEVFRRSREEIVLSEQQEEILRLKKSAGTYLELTFAEFQRLKIFGGT